MKEKTKGYLLVFLAGCCWGLIGVFTNGLASLNLDSVSITMMGQFCATVVMLPVCLIFCERKALKVDRKTLGLLIVLGAVLEACYNLFYVLAIRTIGIAIGVTLLYTSPIFVLIVSRILFSELVTKRKIIAVALNVIGCTLAATGGQFDATSLCLIGIFYGIMTGVCSAMVTIFGKLTTDRAHPFVVTFYLSLFSFLSLFVIVLFRGIPAQCFTGKALFYGMGDGLVSTAIAYILYMSGISKPINPGTASVVASVEIVVASIIGISFFNEQLSLIKIIGILIVLLSIIVMSKGETNEIPS